VEEFGGHGIGHQMHGPPVVPHTGKRGTGGKLRSGMVLTVEPMVNLGRPAIRLMPDGWTVVTEDGSLSAQFEHTILVTREGCEVLTRQELPLVIPVPASPRLAATEPGAVHGP
jgi:methionyl aminopeptidase